MPIEPSIPIAVISQEEFHSVHRVMLGHAFKIHNDFGRLLDERIYKAELAERCLRDGLDAKQEVLIRVRHQAFVKDYFVDLLLGGSAIAEAKTVKLLSEAHRGQAINYLLLAGTHHGSLVNFRTPSVGREFISTHLTHAIRTNFEVHAENWPCDSFHQHFGEAVVAFCSDVGTGLDLPLYREAFAFLLGLQNTHLVPVLSADRNLGHHEMHLLNSETGLAVTALGNTRDYQVHLKRLLSVTPLAGIAWVNLRIGHIELTHLKRQNKSG